MTKNKSSKKGSKKDELELIKFKPSITALSKNKIPGKMHKIIMSYQNWTIERPQYETNKWKLVFQQIDQALFTDLCINQSSTPTLLNQIIYPKFTHLKRLELKCNQIQKIEALCFLDMQLIEEINLETNEITNLSPMDKLNLPKLFTIKFLQNPIETSFEMHRMKCNHDWIDLDLVTSAIECSRYQVETFRCFPKIATKALFFKINKNSDQVKRGWTCKYLLSYCNRNENPFWFTPYQRF